ncbi:MAG: hypothetical protein JOZ51_09120 [Chloroflexi bacterium]|nr:hypothetical protein [Chloroflexota bacterium]
MLDRMIVSSSVHLTLGMVVLLVTLLAMVLTGFLAWRGRVMSRTAQGVVILAQLVLMAQVLVGIKLLDQGAGPLQLYIHYIGGLAPLAGFLVLSWWPIRDPHRRSRVMALATTGAFIFALLTFTIGEAYARGRL